MLEAFRARGVDKDAVNRSGETPLHNAVFNMATRLLMVEQLIKAGANVNVQTGRLGAFNLSSSDSVRVVVFLVFSRCLPLL